MIASKHKWSTEASKVKSTKSIYVDSLLITCRPVILAVSAVVVLLSVMILTSDS